MPLPSATLPLPKGERRRRREGVLLARRSHTRIGPPRPSGTPPFRLAPVGGECCIMASVSKMVADVLQHLFWMIMDQLILKPEYGNAVLFKKGLAFGIILRAQYIVMNGAI